jgi:hypothetical protein
MRSVSILNGPLRKRRESLSEMVDLGGKRGCIDSVSSKQVGTAVLDISKVILLVVTIAGLTLQHRQLQQ